MNKNNKVYIVLIILLIAFFFAMYFLVGKKEIQKQKEELTLLLGEETVWVYQNQNWIDNTQNKNDYNWKKFQVFLDGKYQDEYYVWHDDKWYIFDDNKQPINYTENIIALRSNFDVNLKTFTSEEIEKDNIVFKILKDKGISENVDLTTCTQTKVDIDNDGKNESIYIVSNVFPMDFDPDTIFSLVYMEKDGNIYEIYSKEEKNDYNNGVKPYINSIIDVDNDGEFEIVISYAGYSVEKIENHLYKFINKQFKEII